MSALLKVWVDAKKEAGAQLVAARIREKLRGKCELVSIAEYHKGGHEMHFYLPLDSKEWAAAVYELIGRAQALGRLWTISGVIEEEAYLISNEVPVPGVTSAHLILQKEELNQLLRRNASTGSVSNLKSPAPRG